MSINISYVKKTGSIGLTVTIAAGAAVRVAYRATFVGVSVTFTGLPLFMKPAGAVRHTRKVGVRKIKFA